MPLSRQLLLFPLDILGAWYLRLVPSFAGVEAPAAQNSPVTKICSQCGAVLPSGARVCHFCDSSFSVSFSAMEESAAVSAYESSARTIEAGGLETTQSALTSPTFHQTIQDAPWRGELSQRFKAYRTRRGKSSAHVDQSRFSFDETPEKRQTRACVTIEETPASSESDFLFSIAIG